MTHPLTYGNGCTLEDCHTNVFALAELDGLSYKRLSPDNKAYISPLEDPVLQSFNRCLQADLLVTWKRTSTNNPTEPSLQAGKELWLFWYGDEPATLSKLISADLKVQKSHIDTSSYKKGISYEARVLLFKAIHNLIERCLLTQNYVNIGKWFVQPYDHFGNCNPEKGGHLSMQFSFFLHGESTVCANVDVRQHSPLCKLHNTYLTYASRSNGLNVLLAPYGLSAKLTGQFVRDSDPFSSHLLAEWRLYYVLNYSNDIKPVDRIACVVEVIVDGSPMYYPSCYVFVTGDVDQVILNSLNENNKKDNIEMTPCIEKSKSRQLDFNISSVSPLKEIIFSQLQYNQVSKSSDNNDWNIKEPFSFSARCDCSQNDNISQTANREHAKRVSTPTGPLFHHRKPKPQSTNYNFHDILHEDIKQESVNLLDNIQHEDSPLSSQAPSNDPSSISTPVSNVPLTTSVTQVSLSPGQSQVVPLTTCNVTNIIKSDFKDQSEASNDLSTVLKIPKLPYIEIEDEGEVVFTETLYDYNTFNHWDDYSETKSRKRNFELLSPADSEGRRDKTFKSTPASSTLDDLKTEVKPTHDLPDKLFESESENSEHDMICVPMSPNYKASADLNVMYPTPPSVDQSNSPIVPSGMATSPGNYQTKNARLKDEYIALKKRLTDHFEDFSRKVEENSIYKIPDVAGTVDSECYRPINIAKTDIKTPTYTPKQHPPIPSCYPMVQHNMIQAVPPYQSGRPCAALPHSPQPELVKQNLNKPKNALSIVLTLSDTILGIYKDRNFDSSVICSCNRNIDGSDSGTYISWYDKEKQYKCTCAFSSVLNRTLAFNSGLFYEDEKMISGISYKQSIKPKITENDYESTYEEDESMLKLIINECSQLYDFNDALLPECAPNFVETKLQKSYILQLKDDSAICYKALDMDEQTGNSSKQETSNRACCLHPWSFRDVVIPNNTQDIFRLLKSLQPLLQEALQKKSSERLWEATYTITGPLSYKDFHLLSARGADETSEPQPIPPMIFGLEKQWITVAPQTISYWDKLMLEPAGRQRDVVYVALVPDTDLSLNCSRGFFKELSSIYELLRFGTHRPVNFEIRDSIIRVGNKDKVRSDENIDDWFKNIGSSAIADRLCLYAKVCQYTLKPVLLQALLEYDKLARRQMQRLARPSGTTANQSQKGLHHTESAFIQHSQSSRLYTDSVTDVLRQQRHEIKDAPSYVIYMVNPFSLTTLSGRDARIAHVGLMKCYTLVVNAIPARMQHKIHLQLVSLNTIMQFDKLRSNVRMLAVSIYAKCRRILSPTIIGQPVTSFGPSATLTSDLQQTNNFTRMDHKTLYCPPFMLSIDRNIEPSQLLNTLPNPNVLLCIYCLSADQNWLLVSCTDSTGQIIESQAISVAIPNRDQRQKASARKIGLQKIWDFILSVMSAAVLPWRVVIGRFGRIGHSELLGWSGILSRTHIQETCKRLTCMCRLCESAKPEAARNCPNHNVPYIQSACMVSLEPHPSLRIITDSIKVEEKQNGVANLCTPKHSSVTHILVFPTSAIAQEPAADGTDQADDPDDLFKDFDNFDDSELINSIGGVDSPPLKTSGPNSPSNGTNTTSKTSNQTIRPSISSTSAQEGDSTIQQQPMALGFYISTAHTGPLPDWFWSNCPERKGLLPVCLKSSLHIHCPSAQESDDIQYNMKSTSKHPLDSNATCDVLRYVLEMYNALSWLTVDCEKSERNSCLPIHIVVLMRMYHAFNKYV